MQGTLLFISSTVNDFMKIRNSRVSLDSDLSTCNLTKSASFVLKFYVTHTIEWNSLKSAVRATHFEIHFNGNERKDYFRNDYIMKLFVLELILLFTFYVYTEKINLSNCCLCCLRWNVYYGFKEIVSFCIYGIEWKNEKMSLMVQKVWTQ